MPTKQRQNRSRRARRNNLRKTTSSHRSRPKKNCGGFRVVMPSEYYGKTSSAFTAKPGATSFPSAYGNTTNTSRGTVDVSDVAKGGSTTSNIAPGCAFSGTCRTSGVQTGGRGRRHSTTNKVQRRRRSSSSSAKSRRQLRGTARRSNKNRQYRHGQRGGGGSYGHTSLPTKYVGGTTNSFTSPPGIQTFETAYGPSNPTIYSDYSEGFVNRNLAPGGQTPGTASSGIQTGGGKGKSIHH